MIHSAIVRLTLFYLAIIAALSIGFSVAVYRISSEEFDRPPDRSEALLQLQQGYFTDYEEYLEVRAEEGRAHLRDNLILLNVLTIALGSAASYWFARKTLQPIDEAFAAQGRFTADASHELRTPLTAMQTEIEVGLRNPKLKLSEAKELLRSTLEEVGKLSALANGLLRLTRNSGTDMPLEPVDIASIVSAAITQVQPISATKHITLESKQVAPMKVLGDEHSLREVVVILLDNAVKYSPEETTVTVSARAHGRYVDVSVADQGYGMKASDMPHVFDRFYRADTSRTKRHIEGYGLGLSIAQKIAKAHNGEITVTSKPEKGSTFTVRLLKA